MRKFDVIIWGATSFTGKLVCEYIFKKYGLNTIKWAIAGRDEKKLKEIRSEVADSSVQILIADSFDENSLSNLVRQTKVICSTVGPFSVYGTLLVDLCVRFKTNYCDITGEAHWIRKLIDKFHNKAKSNKIKIVNSCGFDSIPSDMGVFYIQNELMNNNGEYAKEIKMRVSGIKGGISGGTYSSINNVIKDAYANREIFKIINNPYGLNPLDSMIGNDKKDLRKIIYDKDAKSWVMPFVMAGINTKIVRRSNAINNFIYGKDFTYSEAQLTGDGLKGLIKSFIGVIPLALLSMKPNSSLKKILNYYMPKPGEGPNKSRREKGYFNLRFYITKKNGEKTLAKVVGDRDPGYGSTSKMLAESAICLAKDKLPENYGIITPSYAMGDKLLDRLKTNAGLSFNFIKNK